MFTTRLAGGGAPGPGPGRAVTAGFIQSSPDEKGEFALINLPAGAYRVEARPPGDGWYVKSMTVPAGAPGSGPQASSKFIDAGRHGLSLKSAERLTGLTVTFAHGAASLRGQVVPAAKASLPARASLPCAGRGGSRGRRTVLRRGADRGRRVVHR